MNILGLNYFFHDSTASILQDGKLLIAIEEERLIRRKHTVEFPARSAKKCMDVCGMTPSDIHAIAVSIKPSLNAPAKILHGLRRPREGRPFLAIELSAYRARKASLEKWYRSTWPEEKRRPPIHFIPHHLCHAPGTFLVSPYESAALLSIDGSGEWASAYFGRAEGRKIERYSETYFPHSLGAFYEAVTEFCGFRTNYDEGKTMGLAPYGDPKVFYSIVKNMVRVNDDLTFEIDLSYFNHQYWGTPRCSPKFHEVFGRPRKASEPFEDRHHDAAAAFQRVLEESVLELCRQLKKRSKAKHLVIGGGVALNSVMNGRLVRESGFDDLYVMPAAGDNGTGIGASTYLYHVEQGHPRSFVHLDPYVGTSYSDAEIKKALDEGKLKPERLDDPAATGAEILHQGQILGWFQGRMEIGPRALGNRSILADPTRPDMKDKINAEVKHREAFRPFAPSVIVEKRSEYFEIEVEDPFMLKVCYVRPDQRHALPAITHVDGTARLQTVQKDVNPLYYQLMSELGKRNGIPVVLNTSFNVMGEPIVESPFDAIRCFYSTGLDALIMGNYLLRK
ncbi:MAG: carbamoyltransferase [Deltaproteobacteria bacterium]|nr:carbamoyltransferase [Deltaproteobacteria bacterium]